MKLILCALVCKLILFHAQDAQALEHAQGYGPGGIRSYGHAVHGSAKDKDPPHEDAVKGSGQRQHGSSTSVPLSHAVEKRERLAQQPGLALESLASQPLLVLQKPKITLHEHRTASIQSVVTDMQSLSDANISKAASHAHHIPGLVLADLTQGGSLNDAVGLRSRQQFFAPLQVAAKTADSPAAVTSQPRSNRTITAAKPLLLIQRSATASLSKGPGHSLAGISANSKAAATMAGPAGAAKSMEEHAGTAKPLEEHVGAVRSHPIPAAQVQGAINGQSKAGSPIDATGVAKHAVSQSATSRGNQPPVLQSATTRGNNTNATQAGGAFHRWWPALVQHWQRHGLMGSVYGVKQTVQPSLLLGLLVVLFIGAQLGALAFVAYHAQSSLSMLRSARTPCPQRASRAWELIPGISWSECVPYENRQPTNAASQSGKNSYQRRSPPETDPIFNSVARQGWNLWAHKQRGQYMAASSDDGGQAANQARLQDMMAADRLAATPNWARNPTKDSLEKLQRSRADSGVGFPGRDEAWDSLESTLAVATRRADMNKRILDMLHQEPKPPVAPSLDSMLDMEYEAMMQWDIESNLNPGLTTTCTTTTWTRRHTPPAPTRRQNPLLHA